MAGQIYRTDNWRNCLLTWRLCISQTARLTPSNINCNQRLHWSQRLRPKTLIKLNNICFDVIIIDLFAHHFCYVDLCHWYSAVGTPTAYQQQLVQRVQRRTVTVRNRRIFRCIRVEPILPSLKTAVPIVQYYYSTLHVSLLIATFKPQSSRPPLVHWPLMGGLLHLLQWGGDWAGPQPAQAPPRCTKCNSQPINGQCINFLLFDVAL